MYEYKRIPDSIYDIRINENGDVKSFEEGIPDPKVSIDSRGYHTFYMRYTDGRRRMPSKHRMVGILFINIPERLKSYDISELEVNHKDGNKDNNHKSNLEWVTREENIKHARDNELFKSYHPVLVKCDKDNTITRFKSAAEAARCHGLPAIDIVDHIKRPYAGAVSINGYRFKEDNGLPWSDAKIHPNARHGLRLTYKVIGTDCVNNEEWLFTSIPDACNALGLNINLVKYIHTKSGVYKSPDGRWIFRFQELPSIASPREPIITLNRHTGETTSYPSVIITSREIGIPALLLKNHIKSPVEGMVPWNGLYFKRDDGKEFPKAQYLFPELNHMGKTIKHVVFKQCDPTPYLVATISDMCRAFNWDDSCYYDHRKKYGMGALFRGFRIYNIDDIDLGNRERYV